MRLRWRSLFCSEKLEKPTLPGKKKSTCPPFGYIVGKIWTSNLVVMTQVSLCQSARRSHRTGSCTFEWARNTGSWCQNAWNSNLLLFLWKGILFFMIWITIWTRSNPKQWVPWNCSTFLPAKTTKYNVLHWKLSCTPKPKVHNSEVGGK